MIPAAVVCARCKKILGISSSQQTTELLVERHASDCPAHPERRPLWCGHCRTMIGTWKTGEEREELRDQHLCVPDATQAAAKC